MSFQYPLQRIVDLKTNEKQQAEWLFSISVGKLRKQQETMDDLFRLKAEISGYIDSLSRGSARIAELRDAQSYLEEIDRKINLQEQELKSARQEVDSHQMALSERTVDEKKWSQAKGKAYQKYRLMQGRREQSEMDEIAATRYIHSARQR